MARPTKQGIDYFPIDCQFDDKIEMYLIEKEAKGLAVLVSIWQIIYSNEGYYTNNGNDLFLLIKKRVNVDLNEIKECINVCLERSIFDKKLHTKHKVLTSRAIQKRYFDAAKKKKVVIYNIDYIINGIDVGENATNVKVDIEEDIKVDIKVPFDVFWNTYNKKVGKPKCEPKWNKLSEEIQMQILKHIELYKISQPDKQFRKNPEVYLNNKSWEDEIINRNNGNGTHKQEYGTSDDELKQIIERY